MILEQKPWKIRVQRVREKRERGGGREGGEKQKEKEAGRRGRIR